MRTFANTTARTIAAFNRRQAAMTPAQREAQIAGIDTKAWRTEAIETCPISRFVYGRIAANTAPRRPVVTVARTVRVPRRPRTLSMV